MIKRLTSFFLALCLLAVIPLSARYRYNPYTNKLDYYEAAGDITLGDIGDITLTGLATGNVLYYNGAAWVNLATGANTNVLTLVAGIPAWVAAGVPAAHAASHEVAGGDLVNHDQLTGYLAAQHLTLPNTIVAVLNDHDLAAHTALGLFDASADVDHNATTNYAANQHVVLPNTIANVLSDHNVGAHTATIGGTGVNSSGWTDYVYVTAGVWAVDATLGKVADGIAITGAAASTVTITNDNTDGKIVSSTANLILESTGGAATIEITGDLLPSADITYDLGNNTLAWQDLVQTSTGAQYLGDSDVNSTWQKIRSGAMLSFQLREAGAYVEKASLGSTTAFLFNAAADHFTITQTAAAGIEDQPLFFIDDDRTGVTANEISEATIVIDAEGSFALAIMDGVIDFSSLSPLNVRGLTTHFHNLILSDGKNLEFGAGSDVYKQWNVNGAGDDLFSTITANMVQANETSAFWYGVLKPSGMTDHDNYLSPTFIIANDEGADANDYAGVVIGERGQANVKVAHYFDFYAMTGASDGSVATADELAAIFRFGASGSATPGYATTGGDVLFEGTIEVDGDTQVAGYRRVESIYWIECFDHGIAANRYSQNWDITSLNTQGNGTNTIDTTPSNITLTTDNNAVGDNEGTITHFQIILREELNRTEFHVDLGQTANTQYYMGWNTSGTNAMVAAADEYVIVFFDVSDNANWQIKVGDGATEDVFTSAVAADTNHTRHEIQVEADGTVHWSVNGTELDITGSVDNLMTANNHYLIFGQAQSVTGAVVIVAEIHFVENEKTKAH